MTTVTIQDDGHGSLRVTIPAEMKKQGWKKGDKLDAKVGKGFVRLTEEGERKSFMCPNCNDKRSKRIYEVEKTDWVRKCMYCGHEDFECLFRERHQTK